MIQRNMLFFQILIIYTQANVSSSKQFQCYASYVGYQLDRFLNYSFPTNCTKGCFSFIAQYNFSLIQTGSCIGNDTELQKGTFFIVKKNSISKYNVCSSSLCNTNEFSHKLFNSKCEKGKRINKSKSKLIYSSKIFNASSVKQCYYCDKCTTSETAFIINCFTRDFSIKDYSCLVALVFVEFKIKIFNYLKLF